MIEMLDELTTLFHVLMTIENYLSFYNPEANLNFYDTDGSFIGIIPFSRALSMDNGWHDRFVTVSENLTSASLDIYFIS